MSIKRVLSFSGVPSFEVPHRRKAEDGTYFEGNMETADFPLLLILSHLLLLDISAILTDQ